MKVKKEHEYSDLSWTVYRLRNIAGHIGDIKRGVRKAIKTKPEDEYTDCWYCGAKDHKADLCKHLPPLVNWKLYHNIK